jgi:hypothetical protein
MSGERITELRRDPKIIEALCRTALRYFHNEDDQQDAVSEGWEAICWAPDGKDRMEYAKVGMKAIRNMYDRKWRERRKMAGKPCKSGTPGWERARGKRTG